MPSIIDLSNVRIDDPVLSAQRGLYGTPNQENESKINLDIVCLEENERMIKQKYPDKILFTIQELAKELNVSYEFIRNRINRGEIPAIKYGDRKMINIMTLIKLLTYGV